MKGKLFTITLGVAALLCTAFGLAACAQNDNPNPEAPSYGSALNFVLSADGTAYEVKGMGDCTDTHVVIPSTHEGLPVTAIQKKAFSGVNSLQKITIPQSIKKIGENAFWGCDNILQTENSITYVDNWVVGYNDTDENPLTNAVLREQTIGIADNAFENCDTLLSMQFSQSVALLCENIFKGCTALTTFTVAEENGYFQAIDGVLYANDGKTLYKYGAGRTAQNYTVADGVTTVADYAFTDNASLTNVTLPQSLQAIGIYAFSENTQLNDVTFPIGLQTIGESAFFNCATIHTVTLPADLKTIGNSAFRGCSINQLTLNDGLQSIGNSAFQESNIQILTVPNSVKIIGENAFATCTSLASVSIGSGILNISTSAFSSCSNLTSVTITGNDNTVIGDKAFYYCNKLSAFNVTNYKALGAFALQQSALTDITVPANVTVGAGAFSATTTLKTVTFLGNGNTVIEHDTFSACTALTTVTIGEGVIGIGKLAFNACEKLTSVTLPESLTYIEESAFHTCKALQNITLPSKLKTLGKTCFTDCKSLQSITLPASLEKINEGTFSGCAALAEVVSLINGSIDVGNNAFENCAALANVYTMKGRNYLNANNTTGNDAFRTAKDWTYNDQANPDNILGIPITGDFWYFGEQGEIITWTQE